MTALCTKAPTGYKEGSVFPLSVEVVTALENINREMEELMLKAKRNYRKLYINHENFGPILSAHTYTVEDEGVPDLEL